MRAINHALTGAVIGLLVQEPWVAVPVAVASHFVCDAIPHYDGIADPRPSMAVKQQWIRTKTFRRLLYADAFLCFILIAILLARRPPHWWLAAICAFAAAAPDFMSLNLYRRRSHGKLTLQGFNKFASGIQWFQRPIGSVVEVTWFAAAITFLLPLLRA
jgi:hypothetical protein